MAQTDFNPFEVLGLDEVQDADISDKDVERVYRKLSIQYHPDRNKAADATAIFQKLSAAKEMLLDVQARAALREYQQLRQKRARAEADMDGAQREQAKRRREMRDALERRERQQAAAVDEERSARDRLERQLEALRRKAMERVRRAAQIHNGVAAAKGGGVAAPAAPARRPAVSAHTMQQLQRTLKLTWKARASDGLDTQGIEAQLAAALARFGGGAEHIIVSSRGDADSASGGVRKSSKRSAKVVMRTQEGAIAAAQAVVTVASTAGGDTPVLVTPLPKVANLSALTDAHSSAVLEAARRMASDIAPGHSKAEVPDVRPAPSQPRAAELGAARAGAGPSQTNDMDRVTASNGVGAGIPGASSFPAPSAAVPASCPAATPGAAPSTFHAAGSRAGVREHQPGEGVNGALPRVASSASRAARRAQLLAAAEAEDALEDQM